MAMDSKGKLHDPGTDLTATATGTGLVIDGTAKHRPTPIRIHVPQASGTTPTLDAKIQESDTLGSGYTDLVTFDQITAAGQYRRAIVSKRKHIRSVLTVGGTSPNFGKVQVYIDSGGEYKDL